ncbi:MAG: DUF5110 domain-containing protein, partial [Bacteroidales bacterium]|nr:DUF5110 domain-containing protein [Bacteroidales bacterium]
SQAYMTEYAFAQITKKSTSSLCTVTVAAREGSYSGMSEDRKLTFVFGGLDRKPSSVKVNGTVAVYEFDSDTREACVILPVLPASDAIVVNVKY